MKYQRSFLVAEMLDGQERVPSLAVGDWHIHAAIRRPGLTVSHRSGVGSTDGLRPVQAVRLARALSALPPAPVSDQAFRTLVRSSKKPTKAMRAWLVQARAVVKATLSGTEA